MSVLGLTKASPALFHLLEQCRKTFALIFPVEFPSGICSLIIFTIEFMAVFINRHQFIIPDLV